MTTRRVAENGTEATDGDLRERTGQSARGKAGAAPSHSNPFHALSSSR